MAKSHARLNQRRWALTRRRAFDRDLWRCQKCGRPGALEAHHLQRLEDGGAVYDLDNISTLCRSCHIDEHRPAEIPGRAAWAVLVREILLDPGGRYGPY